MRHNFVAMKTYIKIP